MGFFCCLTYWWSLHVETWEIGHFQVPKLGKWSSWWLVHQPLWKICASQLGDHLPHFFLVKNVESLWVATTQTLVCKSTLQVFFPSSFSISSKSSVNKTELASRRITSPKILQTKCLLPFETKNRIPLRLPVAPRDKLLKGEASVRAFPRGKDCRPEATSNFSSIFSGIYDVAVKLLGNVMFVSASPCRWTTSHVTMELVQ